MAAADSLTADDLLAAATACREALAPYTDRDWSVPAGDLDWSCAQVVAHQADALLFYASNLATQSRERAASGRVGDPSLPPERLLGVRDTIAAILAGVVRGAPSGARGFHPAGLADPAGFVGMACTELFIHTADVASGLGVPFRPPDAIVRRVLSRIFPWAPTEGDSWAVMNWAAGRGALPDHPRLAADWYWHCAPLAEWDGTRTVRRPT